MADAPPNLELARGEAISKFHWTADAQETLDLLQQKYGITGPEAEKMVAEAMAIRRGHARKRAIIGLVFAVVGIAISFTYFYIQRSVGFVVIGFGPIFMVLLGLTSFAWAGRNIARAFTGEGPV